MYKRQHDDFEKEFNIAFPANVINDLNPTKTSINIYLTHTPMELLQEIQ